MAAGKQRSKRTTSAKSQSVRKVRTHSATENWDHYAQELQTYMRGPEMALCGISNEELMEHERSRMSREEVLRHLHECMEAAPNFVALPYAKQREFYAQGGISPLETGLYWGNRLMDFDEKLSESVRELIRLYQQQFHQRLQHEPVYQAQSTGKRPHAVLQHTQQMLHAALTVRQQQSEDLAQKLGLEGEQWQHNAVLKALIFCPGLPFTVLQQCLDCCKQLGIQRFFTVMNAVCPQCFAAEPRAADLLSGKLELSLEMMRAYLFHQCLQDISGTDDDFKLSDSLSTELMETHWLDYAFDPAALLWHVALLACQKQDGKEWPLCVYPPHASYLVARDMLIGDHYNFALPIATVFLDSAALSGHPLAYLSLAIFCGNLEITVSPLYSVEFACMKALLLWLAHEEVAYPSVYMDCSEYFMQDGKLRSIKAFLLYNALSAAFQRVRIEDMALCPSYDEVDNEHSEFSSSWLFTELNNAALWQHLLRDAPQWDQSDLHMVNAVLCALLAEQRLDVDVLLPSLLPMWQQQLQRYPQPEDELYQQACSFAQRAHDFADEGVFSNPLYLYILRQAALDGQVYALENVIMALDTNLAPDNFKVALQCCIPAIAKLAQSGHAAAIEFMYEQSKSAPEQQQKYQNIGQQSYDSLALVRELPGSDCGNDMPYNIKQVEKLSHAQRVKYIATAQYLWNCGYIDLAAIPLYLLLCGEGRQSEAYTYLQLAAMSGENNARFLLDNSYDASQLPIGSLLSSWEENAEFNDNVDYALYLAALYYFGVLLPKDRHMAEKWYRIAQLSYPLLNYYICMDPFNSVDYFRSRQHNPITAHPLTFMRRTLLQRPQLHPPFYFSMFMKDCLSKALPFLIKALRKPSSALERELAYKLCLMPMLMDVDDVDLEHGPGSFILRLADGKGSLESSGRPLTNFLMVGNLNVRPNLFLSINPMSILEEYLNICSQYYIELRCAQEARLTAEDLYIKGLLYLRALTFGSQFARAQHCMLLASNAGYEFAPLFYQMNFALWQAELALPSPYTPGFSAQQQGAAASSPEKEPHFIVTGVVQ